MACFLSMDYFQNFFMKSIFDQSLYDKDYFENGISSGKSCYENYRWLPELTLEMAKSVISYLNLTSQSNVLDYGCSKGYLVKAFRLNSIFAYGCDISEYAIENVDDSVKDYCKLITDGKLIPFQDNKFDWLISKDVLEHLSEENIDLLLTEAKHNVSKMFHVIPLGDKNNQFIIPEYHDDPSHITIKNKEWWEEKFNSFGWKLTHFNFNVKGIKDKWYESNSKGNGFFIFEKK